MSDLTPEAAGAVMDDFDRWYEWPDWAKDLVVVDCNIHLSLRDALKVLWRRSLTVSTKTFTANVVGRAESLSHVSLPRWRDQPKVGYVEVPRA